MIRSMRLGVLVANTWKSVVSVLTSGPLPRLRIMDVSGLRTAAQCRIERFRLLRISDGGFRVNNYSPDWLTSLDADGQLNCCVKWATNGP